MRPAKAFGVLLVTLALSGPDVAQAYQQEIHAAAAKISESLAKKGKKSVAVVDFTDLQGNVTELGRFLAEKISVALGAEDRGFDVVDRTHLKTLLKEHKLSASGLVDPQTAKKLGQLSGADCLVTGSLTPLGDTVSLSLKVLDTNTARMITAADLDIPRTKAIEELLSKGIGFEEEKSVELAPDSATKPTLQKPKSQKQAATTPGFRAESSGSLASMKLGDVLIEIRDCKSLGAVASCSGLITNRSSVPIRAMFWNPCCPTKASAVDDRGHQTDSFTVIMGSQRGTYGQPITLEPDLPISIAFESIPVTQGATRITIRHQLNIDGQIALMSLRDLPLR